MGENELKVMWVAEADWEYRRAFTVEKSLLAQPNIVLACDGLDTIADVYMRRRQGVTVTVSTPLPAGWKCRVTARSLYDSFA